ncbi:MAG TPA: HAMP domain-containing sensor histidine kinase [Bryobacteraceae bacterium]|nr:HAMP domain-containing sensor histidine kinase [Bryobacteraceae bacterium]
MKRTFSLSTKIFLLAFLNLLLLGAVFLILARVEFRFELRSFLLSPARDRILSVSRLIALQLPTEPQSRWNETLAQYSGSYPAEFFLFTSGAKQLAGRQIQLPAALRQILLHDPFHQPARASAVRPGPVVPPSSSERDPGPPAFFIETQGPRQYWAVAHIPLWTDFAKEPEHGNLVWRINSLLNDPFYFDYRPWAALMLSVAAVSVLCWLPFIRGLTRSIGQLTRATGRIAGGQFDVALNLKRRDEMGRLAESISRMAHRLSELVNGQRRFLGDIAHELCSPIARIQVAMGILEQHATEDELVYVNDVREEVDHMSTLVNELLSFSKAELGASLHLARVNVADTVARVLQRESAEFLDVRTEINQQLDVIAEPEYLFRSLANIVRNAIRYAGNAGPVRISARNGDGQVTITVADSGPGVPERELEKIFKPFYRPDQARQRETGGTGLGLAIVKTCIEACGGTVGCRNLSPSGLAVEIRLPAA